MNYYWFHLKRLFGFAPTGAEIIAKAMLDIERRELVVELATGKQFIVTYKGCKEIRRFEILPPPSLEEQYPNGYDLEDFAENGDVGVRMIPRKVSA